MLLTRDQKYAISAFEHVQRIKNSIPKKQLPEDKTKKQEETEGSAKSYGVMAHKLPILIYSAGLAQALAFVESRGNKRQKILLNDLAITVGYEDKKALLEAARKSDLRSYIRLTHQILNALLWYKRYAQSELGVDVGDTVDEEPSND